MMVIVILRQVGRLNHRVVVDLVAVGLAVKDPVGLTPLVMISGRAVVDIPENIDLDLLSFRLLLFYCTIMLYFITKTWLNPHSHSHSTP